MPFKGSNPLFQCSGGLRPCDCTSICYKDQVFWKHDLWNLQIINKSDYIRVIICEIVANNEEVRKCNVFVM